MTQYRKKPVVIDAWRYPGHSIAGLDALLAFEEWFESKGGKGRYIGQNLHVLTLEDGPNGEAKHVADPGDWIICGVAGELYPCKPDIFAATYEDAALSGSPQVEAGTVEQCARIVENRPEAAHNMGFYLAAKEIRALRPREQEGGEAPVAWLHTLHMEGGQTNKRVTMSPDNGHGKPGKDYSEEYEVTTEALYRHPAPLPADGWKDMASAPRDGTEILLYSKGMDVILARWIAPCDFLGESEAGLHDANGSWEDPDWFGADFVSGFRVTNDGEPTAWRPLPTPPASTEGGK